MEEDRSKLTRDTDILAGKLTLDDRRKIQKEWNKAILKVSSANKKDVTRNKARKGRK